ncbi:hypothetical protein [Paenibacillus caui]|uniref:hypothetical protein n=1 Tax=Paenibacillus caui TaxID=2873927 RepID=UPI001CA97C13|nr:hypothetical protein [Paenibacillus caui]
MKKLKFVSSLLLITAIFFPVLVSAESLNPQEAIQQETKKIADAYEIGEKLSEKDLKIILNNVYSVKK